ncbi:hypothetical protein ZOSMA_267G00220 [Zostera marina]|uniref:Transcription repressor n=1 Tax=Zostera marina TaxID=29655 RepID=A0A0K9PES0_ZOSMR|nr:hypothetical protein ZOSMA_267G00220 [Zostera marina]
MGRKTKTKSTRVLGSSIKAIQEAIANLIPVVSPTCMHQSSRTHSSRDDNINQLVSISGRNKDRLIPTTTDAVTRFYFSPRTTKSILEERKIHLGGRKVRYSSDLPYDPHPMEMDIETTGGACDGGVCFCEESVHMVIVSDDPYRDFKDSMEEMVEAHGLREFSELHQLLHCYLRINDEKKHSIIMFSFIDLLMQHLICSSSQSLAASDDDRHNHTSSPLSS